MVYRYNKMNLQENIRRVLKEETKLSHYVRRRYNCMDDYISLLEKEPEIIPIRVRRLDWANYQIILTAYIRANCGDGNGYYDPYLHELIMNVFGERLFNWYKKIYDMNLQESIRRILREEANHTNLSVNIGDVYEESDIYTYIQKLHYKRDYDFWEGDLGERIEKFPYYIVKEVPIENIEMDEYQLDEDDMEEYIKMFKERGSYPPIVLGSKSYGYYNIIDGTHRANALRELGFDKIICFVGKKKI